MRIIARPILIRFAKQHPSADQPMRAWYAEVKKARWKNAGHIKKQYGSASILPKGRAVFNIGGHKYRIVVAVHYNTQIVFIRFIGTHQEYDLIDARTI